MFDRNDNLREYFTVRSDSTLTLFIPDLFGFQSTLNNLSSEEKSSLPSFEIPVLEKWLSRGLFEKSSNQEDSVFLELGLEHYKEKPFAALSLLAEKTNLEFDNSIYWLRADPVNLQPDRDTALLAGHEELALSQEEADKLVTQINEHFIDEPWELYSLTPHRWYLRSEKPIALNTTPLAKVIGEDINQYSPSGNDSDYWFKIMNELQMLIHNSSVNFERESRNMWTANSVWLWGGGCLSGNSPTNIYDTILSNNIIFKGVARHCNFKFLKLDNTFHKSIDEKSYFIVLDTLSEQVQRRDLYTFVKTLNSIENEYLIHCNKLLTNGSVGIIKLITDVGVFSITKKSLGRWWKRGKQFSTSYYE